MSLALLLAGLYFQACSHGLQKTQDFRGAEMIYSESNFSDPDCSQPSLITRSYGNFSLGKAAESGIREIDFVFSGVTLEPLTTEVAADFRARRLCGLVNWEKEVPTEITGLFCDFSGTGSFFPVPAKGNVRYGIMQEAAAGLYFGRLTLEYDATSPESRPRELDPVPYVKNGLSSRSFSRE